MNNPKVKEIIDELRGFLRAGKASPFNYEKYLLLDKARYLDAFIEDKPFSPFEVEVQVSSKCNNQCRWCIGNETQEKRRVLRLQDNITDDNIDSVVDGIINFRINGIGIETVKFSGFIGEPLLHKKATLKAIQRLTGAGIQVGLFTNGILMNDDITRETLVNINYVHVSLDAGHITYTLLKESPDKSYTNTFDKILNNIKELSILRKKKGGKVKINIGYVVVPANISEIYSTTKLVKENGADSIRFKCDIGGKYDLQQTETVEAAFKEIERVMQSFNVPPSFNVHVIHSKDDVINKNYTNWKCENGCFYHHFLGTVGSDGNLYLCDHNTMPGAIALGNVLNQSFEEIWKSKQRDYLIHGIRYVCQCPVCPTFGRRINFFLKKVDDFKNLYGISCTKEAIDELRAECMEESLPAMP